MRARAAADGGGAVTRRTLTVTGSIKVGERPWGIVLSPDGKYLFAANGPSNDVSVVDLAAGKEIARVKAGGSPWGAGRGAYSLIT